MKQLQQSVLFIKKNKDKIFFILIISAFYLLFFKNIFNAKFNFWTSDAAYKMFPTRVYIYEKISQFDFPFWTDRIFLGYPLYLDIEQGILNPINILSIFIFGPVWSLKILHIFTYLFGSYCIYKLSKIFYPESNFLISALSVLSFYFSFFHLNHLIHMNIVLVSMLLPIHVYLVFLYFENPKPRYLVYQILLFAYGVLWGQPQNSLFIFFIIAYLYFYLTKDYKKTISYSIFLLLSTFFLTLYQLYPSFSVFFSSPRVGNILKYSEYSNSPTILLNNLFPYSLGYFQNFRGYEVSGAFSYVEVYTYLGIVSAAILVFYLLYGYGDKYYRLVLNSIYFYLIFTFISIYFPFRIPIYSDFRYWTRGIFLLSFLLIFPINYLFSKMQKLPKPSYKNLLFLIIFLVVSFFFESKDFINFVIENQLNYIKKIDVLVWVGILSSTIFLLFFFFKSKVSKIYLIFALLILSTFDLRYYASDLLPVRVSRYKSEANFKTDSDCQNKRCLLENTSYNGNEFLLFKSFSPYGYSQFIDKEYIDFFNKNFYQDIDRSPRAEIVRPELDVNYLSQIGFQKILLANGKSLSFPQNNFWIFRDNLKGQILSYREGEINFEVNVEKAGSYLTNLKYSKNFQLSVNGNSRELEKEGIFSKIYLESGKNNVKLKYFPTDIILGLGVGFIGLLFIFLIFNKQKFYSFFKRNNI